MNGLLSASRSIHQSKWGERAYKSLSVESNMHPPFLREFVAPGF